jgi:hypothetical protein
MRSDASVAFERAELFRRQQHEELFRLMQMQQFQLPGEDLFTLQSKMRGVIPFSVPNPYALGGMYIYSLKIIMTSFAISYCPHSDYLILACVFR